MNKNTKIFIVRHGETEWNRLKKQQGHLDSPLTELGVRQAEALAGGLYGRGIEIIFSSDLGRALRTAEIINNKLSVEIIQDAGLRERNLGIMENLSKKEFNEKYPEEFEKFISGDPNYILPNGESRRQRYNRINKCIGKIVNKNTGKIIAIVTHGGALHSLFCKVLNIPLIEPRRIALFNASINIFSIIDGVWRLDTWGDINHLGDMGTLDDN
jgi:probable phosphoglycerate mutase